MAKPTRPDHISFDLSSKKAPESAPVDEEAPLRIAILGNFSGRSEGAGGGTSSCRALVVDCDNFDSVCSQFGASLDLPPCAEAWLTGKAAALILARGLMPVLSVRGRDSVLLPSLRSISEPARSVAFRVG